MPRSDAIVNRTTPLSGPAVPEQTSQKPTLPVGLQLGGKRYHKGETWGRCIDVTSWAEGCQCSLPLLPFQWGIHSLADVFQGISPALDRVTGLVESE